MHNMHTLPIPGDQARASKTRKQEGEPTMPEVIFTHERPPVPTRNLDWRAGFDGREEEGRDGFGETKLKAALDLYHNCEDADDALAAIVGILRADQETFPADWAGAHSGYERAINLIRGIG